MTDLLWQVEAVRPAELRRATFESFLVEGWVFERRRATERIWAQLDDLHLPALAVGIESPAVYDRYRRSHHRSAHAAQSGFIVAGVVCAGRRETADLHIGVELEDGSRHATAGVPIAVRPYAPSPLDVAADVEIAIVMASYDPRLDLFERQIDTIRRQTYESWCCVISDDASDPRTLDAMRRIVGDDDRFRILTQHDHVGFYLNFERALAAVPESVGYVALADQDDAWRPDKLTRLLETLTDQKGATLAASDVRIATPEGAILAETFYADRVPTHDDPYSLFLVNSLVGAAMLFPRSLLDLALPFPRAIDAVYHDHWLARVALLTGTIAFTPEPLHDYVQHDGNVLGLARKGSAQMREVVRSTFQRCLGGAPLPSDWRRAYVCNVVEPWLAAHLLTARLSAPPPDWLRRVMQLDCGQLRELCLLMRDYRGDSRCQRRRREFVEQSLFAGRVWALDHQPTAISW